MPAGSKPGERRGGKRKGTPNKLTQAMAAATVSDRKDISSAMMPVIRQYVLGLQTAKGRELAEGIKTMLPYVLPRLSDVKLSGGDGPPLRLVLYMPTPDREPEYTPPTQGGK